MTTMRVYLLPVPASEMPPPVANPRPGYCPADLHIPYVRMAEAWGCMACEDMVHARWRKRDEAKGWVCPNCGRGLAPHVEWCPCWAEASG